MKSFENWVEWTQIIVFLAYSAGMLRLRTPVEQKMGVPAAAWTSKTKCFEIVSGFLEADNEGKRSLNPEIAIVRHWPNCLPTDHVLQKPLQAIDMTRWWISKSWAVTICFCSSLACEINSISLTEQYIYFFIYCSDRLLKKIYAWKLFKKLIENL